MHQEAADRALIDRLRQLRIQRGLSMKDFARCMGYDASYVSHIENGRHHPSREFIRRADHCLRAEGGLLSFHTQTSYAGRLDRATSKPGGLLDQSIVIEAEHARLTLADGVYRCDVQRTIKNDTRMVVTELPVSVEVDRFPNDREQSREYYLKNPLKLDELQFRATLDQAGNTPLLFKLEEDRDSLKRLRVFFQSPAGRFPLYPGRTATLHYSYEVREPQYGSWFQREIRFPTSKLSISISIDLPAGRTPWVHGSRLSLSGIRDLSPNRYGIADDVLTYRFETEDAPLMSQFLFEWSEQPRTGFPWSEEVWAA